LSPDEVLDPRGKAMPGFGRDPQRTPMQWTDGQAAGFSTGQPWLPLSADHERRNVTRQREDDRSLLCLYRKLLELRGREPALQVGDYAPVTLHSETIAYVRTFECKRFLIVLNFSPNSQSLDLPRHLRGSRTLVSTAGYDEIRADSRRLTLSGWEGQIVPLEECLNGEKDERR
jgi:alpha-glucosidase